MKQLLIIATCIAILISCNSSKPKAFNETKPSSKEVALNADTSFVIDKSSFCVHITIDTSADNKFHSKVFTLHRNGKIILTYPLRSVLQDSISYQIASIYLIGENLNIYELFDNTQFCNNALPYFCMKNKNITSNYKTDTAISNYILYAYPATVYENGPIYLDKKEWKQMADRLPDYVKNDKYKALMFNFGQNAKDFGTVLLSKLDTADVAYLQGHNLFQNYPAPIMRKLFVGNN
jgi:hypothetical protein